MAQCDNGIEPQNNRCLLARKELMQRLSAIRQTPIWRRVTRSQAPVSSGSWFGRAPGTGRFVGGQNAIMVDKLADLSLSERLNAADHSNEINAIQVTQSINRTDSLHLLAAPTQNITFACPSSSQTAITKLNRRLIVNRTRPPRAKSLMLPRETTSTGGYSEQPAASGQHQQDNQLGAHHSSPVLEQNGELVWCRSTRARPSISQDYQQQQQQQQQHQQQQQQHHVIDGDAYLESHYYGDQYSQMNEGHHEPLMGHASLVPVSGPVGANGVDIFSAGGYPANFLYCPSGQATQFMHQQQPESGHHQYHNYTERPTHPSDGSSVIAGNSNGKLADSHYHKQPFAASNVEFMDLESMARHETGDKSHMHEPYSYDYTSGNLINLDASSGHYQEPQATERKPLNLPESVIRANFEFERGTQGDLMSPNYRLSSADCDLQMEQPSGGGTSDLHGQHLNQLADSPSNQKQEYRILNRLQQQHQSNQHHNYSLNDSVNSSMQYIDVVQQSINFEQSTDISHNHSTCTITLDSSGQQISSGCSHSGNSNASHLATIATDTNSTNGQVLCNNHPIISESELANCSSTNEEPELKICEWEGCGNTFLDMTEFVRHLEEKHVNLEPRERNRYFCLWSNCKRNQQEFNARYKLLIHMRVHSGEKPYSCEDATCNKSFSRLENLKIHVRSHTGEKPYKCSYVNCTKSFTNSSDRIKHHKTHRDPKPYTCSHEGCPKRYTDPSSLRKHLRAHKRNMSAYETSESVSMRQEHLTPGEQRDQPMGQPSAYCTSDFDPTVVFEQLAESHEFYSSNGSQAHQANGSTSGKLVSRSGHDKMSHSWCFGARNVAAKPRWSTDGTLVSVNENHNQIEVPTVGRLTESSSGQWSSGASNANLRRGQEQLDYRNWNHRQDSDQLQRQHQMLNRSMPHSSIGVASSGGQVAATWEQTALGETNELAGPAGLSHSSDSHSFARPES